MDNFSIDALLLKVAGTSTAAGSVIGSLYVHGQNIPFFNVSISTFGMSAAGSMIAFAYGTPIESRKKLYGYAIGGTFIGIWGLQLLMLYGIVIDPEFRPPVSGAIALLSRWIVPFFVDNFPMIWGRIFGRTPPPGDV